MAKRINKKTIKKQASTKDTKKKAAKKKATKRAKRQTIPEELYLKPEENNRLLYLDALLKNNELSIRLKQQEFTREVESIRASSKEARLEMVRIRTEVEERLGIKMSDYSYHSETGRLNRIPGK